MKKILFATTALVATATVAAADVTVGGWGYVGVTKNAAGTNVTHGTRVTFSASVDTDSGVTFTASSRITTTDNNDNGMLSHNKITVESGAFKLAVGATHGAMKTLARTVAFYGYDNGGLWYQDGNPGLDSNVGLGDGGNNILATYSAGDFTVGLATDVAGTTTELAAKYAAGAFSVGVGFNDNSDWQVALGYSINDLSLGLGANSNDDVVLKVDYKLASGTTLGLAAERTTAATQYGVQASHDLGGGARLVGAAGKNLAGNTVASLGVMFNF